MRYYFSFKLTNGQNKAAVAYSVERAMQLLNISIEAIACWDNVKTDLPVGAKHA